MNLLVVDNFDSFTYMLVIEVMAIRHRTLPLWGGQFHPEAALTQGGLQVLTNWVELAKMTQFSAECVRV